MIQWNLATVGTLSRNKFWGEDETTASHPILATSTVIQTENETILVDPSMEGKRMAAAVYDHCGIKEEEISVIYLTHHHFDHWTGIEAFPNATVMLTKEVLADIRTMIGYMIPDHNSSVYSQTMDRLNSFQVVADTLVPGIQIVKLPGHTKSLSGLLFESDEGRILIAADAVMNRDFFSHGEAYYYGYSVSFGRESVKTAAQIADIIIPGHGNYFLSGPIKTEPDHTEYPWVNTMDKSAKSVLLQTSCSRFLDVPPLRNLLAQYFPEITDQKLSLGFDVPIGALLFSLGTSEETLQQFLLDMKSSNF